MSEIASGYEEIVAPFRLIEVTDVVDKAPKEEEEDDAAPEFGGDKEDRLDPVSIDRDPMGVLLTPLFEEPVGRFVRGEAI